MSTLPAIFSPMTLADVPVVGALEQVCFPAPWSAETYRNELLHNRYSLYWVLRPAPGHTNEYPSVLAYGGFWLMGEEAHIVTIASHPNYRRHGLGGKLLMAMVGEAHERGATSVTLEVRVSNTAAQHLYMKLGFVEVGLRKGYYHDNGEDAFLMTIYLT